MTKDKHPLEYSDSDTKVSYEAVTDRIGSTAAVRLGSANELV